MARLVSLTLHGQETGFAVSPADFETEMAQDGSGKTWQAAGYKLGHFEDTREPFKAPARASAPAESKKSD